MSASLVGSEMCIRDRAPSRCFSDCRAASGFDHLRIILQQKTAKSARESVSYTHLTLPTICSV
eukprot:4387992-Alexandrium_andersonii.AAC.1